MRNSALLFAEGNTAQQEKLDLYADKPDWKDMTEADLLTKLQEEYWEVQEAIDSGNKEELRLELADLANVAHFWIQKINRELREQIELAHFIR